MKYPAMLKGPKIKLAVDLKRIGRYFPLGDGMQEGFGFDPVTDRSKYDEMAAELKEYGVTEERIILECCFLVLWVQEETGSGEGSGFGKFQRMKSELAELNLFLMKHRITSVAFRGKSGRNLQEREFHVDEEINIDRLCDGLRCIFRDDFEQDPGKKKSKGLAAWRRKKMERIRNNFLSYFTSVQDLDNLSLEEQNQLIDRLAALAGIKPV